ncbi:MAG: hypothetical protein WD638_02230 [Nitriliruptoraceae bacterium]
MDPSRRPTTIARAPGQAGELALREHDGAYEIISNGVFLMDTSDGRSERELVSLALAATAHEQDRHVLLAGLGVGFSLSEALSTSGVTRIVVIESEPAVVHWNRTITGERTGGRVDDPRVRCEVVDVVTWLQGPITEHFDAICLDVDNGPDWTVRDENRWLYTDAGLTATHDRLVDGGALTVWSAEHAPAFERRLRRRFHEVEQRELPVARGGPDVLYLARRRGCTDP